MATVRRKTIAGGLNRLRKAAQELDALDLKVGWFESQRYEDPDNTGEQGEYVAQVAAKNELGIGVPPRPFVRPTIAEKKNEWKSQTAAGVSAILNGHETAKSVMEKLGLRISGQIRKSIRKVQTPPLSEFTIQRRLEIRAVKIITPTLRKPLVFEGILLGSTSYVVQDGEPQGATV